MDSDFRVDIGEIFKSLDTADVVSLYFPLIGKTLLVDRRRDALEGPMVKVVPMADSVEDRFKSLKRLRPGLPVPQTIAVIPWPKYVASLRRLGIWEHIVQSFQREGQSHVLESCARAFEELSSLERAELHRALSGEQYRTLWESAQ